MPAPESICIPTERLTLRPFTEGDAAETFAAITPGLTRFMNWEAPASPEIFSEVWRPWLSATETVSDIHFVIRAGPGFVGIAGLHGLGVGVPELGIWIKEALQGNGYGHEAVTALIAWASERFEVAGFAWPVAVENLPSRNLAGKLGGTLVARFDRPTYDAVLYRIPAPDTAGGIHAGRSSSTERRLASKSSGAGKRLT